MAKYANNDAREMEFSSPDAEEDGEHNGVSFEEITKVFVAHDAFQIGMAENSHCIHNQKLTVAIYRQS